MTTPADDLQPIQFDTAVSQDAGALDAPAARTCRNCGLSWFARALHQ